MRFKTGQVTKADGGILQITERAALSDLVGAFFGEVEKEVLRHQEEGKRGWDTEEYWTRFLMTPRQMPTGHTHYSAVYGVKRRVLAALYDMQEKINRRDYEAVADQAVDIAALAMFLWNLCGESEGE